MKPRGCVLALGVSLLCFIASARTITVDDDGPADFNNIQAAINDANEADTVVVKPGHYNEMITIDINMVLTSENPEDPCVVASTIIDACGLGSVITLSGAEGPNCIITGFTVTGGNGYGAYAGIDGNGSLATITNCIIRDNTALQGGLWMCDGPISNCEIRNNENYGVDRCRGNMWNCLIVGSPCNVWVSGWSIWPNPNSSSDINNCTIAKGSTGVLLTDRHDLHISNSVIRDNEDRDFGLSSCAPKGCPTITVNYSIIQNDWSGDDQVYPNNCMVVDPCFADPCSGDYHLKSEYGRWDPNSQTWVTDSVTSPAIDAGDPNSDWTGELWPHGKRINMGAYGGTPQASMSGSTVGNIANLDDDPGDSVGLDDLALFADKWLYQIVLLPEDLDRNGSVDFRDSAIFADEWFEGI